MIAEYIVHGALIGLGIFFGVFVFILCCGVLVGLAAMMGTFIKGGEKDD